MALGPGGNIYVVTSDTVIQFGAGASGNVAPIAIIHGPATGLESANAIAVDLRGDIYVAMGNQFTAHVVEFAPGTTGDVGPIGTVSADTLDRLTPRGYSCELSALTFDRGDNLYVRCGEGAVGRLIPSSDAIRRLFGELTGLDSKAILLLLRAGIYGPPTLAGS